MDLTDTNISNIVLTDESPTLTPSKILESMVNAWVNEKNSPDLLKHESELVEYLINQIQNMEESLVTLDRDNFRLVPHQMEIDRIRYLVSSYLRYRLEKIEVYSIYLLKRDKNITNEEDRYMSKGEFRFAENFISNLKTHCNNEVFKYMPAILRDFGENVSSMEIKPNLMSTVFIRVVTPVANVLICDQVVNLSAGSRHLLPYKDVAFLVKNGSVLLI